MINEDDVQLKRHKRALDDIRSERNARESDSNGRPTEDRARGSGEDERGNESNARGTTRGTQESGETNGPFKRLRKRIRPIDGETLDTTQSDRRDDKPAKEPVKLLTEKEAEENREHLIEVYQFLSSLPDDFLEIIVKDHEPVQIWAMSHEEAETFVNMRLAQAKKNKAVALEVRRMLDIYERMYFYLYLYPRLIATGRHVTDHRGFSFK